MAARARAEDRVTLPWMPECLQLTGANIIRMDGLRVFTTIATNITGECEAAIGSVCSMVSMSWSAVNERLAWVVERCVPAVHRTLVYSALSATTQPNTTRLYSAAPATARISGARCAVIPLQRVALAGGSA
jgi:hypothetical protein